MLLDASQDGQWTFGLFECWGPRERLGGSYISNWCCIPCLHTVQGQALACLQMLIATGCDLSGNMQ